jgi:hypothetical protein
MASTNWVYVRSESRLWTVGFYSPDGEWHTDSDHGSREEATQRVHYLNGGSKPELLNFAKLISDFFTDDGAGHAKYLKKQADNVIRKAEESAK